MISSQILSGLNADGDHKKSILIENRTKRMNSIQPFKRIKTMDIKKNFAEEFFLQSHPFSDLILLVQGISNMFDMKYIFVF